MRKKGKWILAKGVGRLCKVGREMGKLKNKFERLEKGKWNGGLRAKFSVNLAIIFK